jgi:hypothetical protein
MSRTISKIFVHVLRLNGSSNVLLEENCWPAMDNIKAFEESTSPQSWAHGLIDIESCFRVLELSCLSSWVGSWEMTSVLLFPGLTPLSLKATWFCLACSFCPSGWSETTSCWDLPPWALVSGPSWPLPQVNWTWSYCWQLFILAPSWYSLLQNRIIQSLWAGPGHRWEPGGEQIPSAPGHWGGARLQEAQGTKLCCPEARHGCFICRGAGRHHAKLLAWFCTVLLKSFQLLAEKEKKRTLS